MLPSVIVDTLYPRSVTAWFGLVFGQKNVRTNEIFIGLVWFSFHYILKKKPNQTSRFGSVG